VRLVSLSYIFINTIYIRYIYIYIYIYILDIFLDIAFVHVLEAKNRDDKQDLKSRASCAMFYSASQFIDSNCETIVAVIVVVVLYVCILMMDRKRSR